MDPDCCWRLAAEAVREAMQRAKAQPRDVLGLAVTGMRHGLVLLDSDGRELFAVSRNDARAVAESLELANAHGDLIYQRTGRWPLPISTAARLRWLAAHLPDLYGRAAVALSLSDWLAFRLCGQLATEPTLAGESLVFDLKTRDWAWDLIEELELPRRLFPAVREAGGLLGSLSVAAAAALGLEPGIPVAVGGADTQCGLLGAGVIEPGGLAAVAGTTTSVQQVIERPLLDPAGRLWTGHHLIPGRWVLESNAGAAGQALDWLAEVLYSQGPHPVAILLAEAESSAPGAGGLLSSFGAQIMDARNMGLPMGCLTLSQLLGDSAATRRRCLARAVLEGQIYALRANLDQLAAVAGATPELHLLGGVSESALWNQLVSDVLGMPIVTPRTPQATALGAVICAGVAAGVFRDLREGVARLASASRRYLPDRERTRAYEELYRDWMRLRETRAASDELAASLLAQGLQSSSDEPASPPPARFRPRILVTAALDEASLADLRQMGEVCCANFRETLRVLSGDDLVEALRDTHVFVTEIDVIDADVLRRLPDLRLVIACRGRPVNVDTVACTALGIPVFHAPGRNADAVADLTVGFMLALSRRLMLADAFLHRPDGEPGDLSRLGQAHHDLVGHELRDRTVGLVGLGAVGRAVARRLAAFGARVLATDPSVTAAEAALASVELVGLDHLLEESDILSLHANLTDTARGLIGARELARMKPGAFLINTARAGLVDEGALVEALRSGLLGGAALDVFAIEPPGASHPLLALPNVVVTPHIAGNTAEVAAHQGQMIVEDLRRLLAGHAPLHVLNPETLAHFTWEGSRIPPDNAVFTERLPRHEPAICDLQQRPLLIPAVRSGPSVNGDGLSSQSEGPGGRAWLERVLRSFLKRARTDAVLLNFASNRAVAFHYVVSDLGLEFYLDFRQGTVQADLGAPPLEAEVRLKARVEILDKIFTGQLSGTKAALSGKLSYAGNILKAMSLQKLQPDLIRLYTAAREEVGGPAADDQKAPAVQHTGANLIPAPTASAGDAREAMAEAIRELFAAGLITATGGNLSVRVPGREEAWITPAQLFKGGLRSEMMVRINLEGDALDPEAPAPSSERLVHTAIYKARPDVQAVVHAHAPYATILGLTDLPFLPITTEAAQLKEVAYVRYHLPGSRELAQAVVTALGRKSAVLLQNHGVVVAAGSLRRALDVVEIVERTAQMLLGCYALGKTPPTLPPAVVEELRQLGEVLA